MVWVIKGGPYVFQILLNKSNIKDKDVLENFKVTTIDEPKNKT